MSDLTDDPTALNASPAASDVNCLEQEAATSSAPLYVLRLLEAAAPNQLPKRALRLELGEASQKTRRHFYDISCCFGDFCNYELRLGPFASEVECDAILSVVRKRYPNAYRVAAGPVDLEAISAAMTMQPATSSIGQGMGVADNPATIDNTDTVRELSEQEIQAHESASWYCVELLRSDIEFEPREIPELDLFDQYCLYSVTSPEGTVPRHSLRLGFFSGELSAQSIASYLLSYFDTAVVVRVSGEERMRFASRRVSAQKDVGATGRHEVIVLRSGGRS